MKKGIVIMLLVLLAMILIGQAQANSNAITIILKPGQAVLIKTAEPNTLCVVVQGERVVHVEAEVPDVEGGAPGGG